jgi:hypothetical protein
MATQASAITFLSTPGQAYANTLVLRTRLQGDVERALGPAAHRPRQHRPAAGPDDSEAADQL